MGSYRGLKIAKAATNLVALSWECLQGLVKTATLVSGTQYTVSVRGKGGSVTLTGAATGTVTESSPLTFTASGTTLTITPVGYLKHVQVEKGNFATADIWTHLTAETRPADAPAPMLNLQQELKLGQSQGAFIIHVNRLISGVIASPFATLTKAGSTDKVNSIRFATHTAGTGQFRLQVYINSVLTERILTGVNLLTGGTVGISWSATEIKTFYNGTLVDTYTVTVPQLLDTLSFSGVDNEVIYKGYFLFKNRPADSDMLTWTNLS